MADKNDIARQRELLFSTPIPAKFSLIGEKALSRLVIKRYDFNVDHVRACVADNGWSEMNREDVHYAILIVLLSSQYNAIPVSSDATATIPAAKTHSLVTQSELELGKAYAKVITVASLHYICQEPVDGEIRWYAAFEAAYGNFISETKFGEICEILMTRNAMLKFSKIVTIGEVAAYNKVVKHSFDRLSSPSLVFTAMNAILSSDVLLSHIDSESLQQYLDFHQCGIAAQVASGPLKIYCIGNVNPLKQTDMSPSVKICELSPVTAPYDARLLRKTKIILEEYWIEHGKWYQGIRAMKGMSMCSDDRLFRVMVRAVIRQKQEANNSEMKWSEKQMLSQ